ncbi:hypothetical protein MNBD_NITROSPINAE02-33 [hydrothermal vent metagenome]|uniref:Zinc-finger domain-containing protein n=1 Tax=hydrothermal vent metagenome TaxID=652676 RepID=A0A3B1CHX9_9ZZZZ
MKQGFDGKRTIGTSDNMEHLIWADLLAYGDPSLKDNERELVATHMKSCPTCRDRYISIQSLRGALKKTPPPFIPFDLTIDCIPEELLGDFLGSRLPSSEQNIYSNHTIACDICFERAAYLSWAGAKMAEGSLAMNPTPERYKAAILNRAPAESEAPRPSFSVWNIASRWIKSPVPAYAFAASLAFFVFFGAFGGQEGVVPLTDDQVFTLYEKPSHSGPSFGFSDAGRKVGEVEAGLTVNREDDGRFRFGWKPVEGASDYNFYLTRLDTAGADNFFDTKTALTEVYTGANTLSPGSVYTWRVTGSTQTGDIFVARGQFALPK